MANLGDGALRTVTQVGWTRQHPASVPVCDPTAAFPLPGAAGFPLTGWAAPGV